MKPHKYASWQLRPQKLSKKEAKNPYIVFHKFFDYANLPQTRAILWSWISCTVTGGFTEELDRIERDRIMTMYERVEKLVDAAHVLHIAQKEKTKKLKKHE